MKRRILLNIESFRLKISKAVLSTAALRIIAPFLIGGSLLMLISFLFELLPFFLSGAEIGFPRFTSSEPVRSFEILKLFLCLWVIVLLVYLFKSLIIWLHHTFLKKIKRKSSFEIWNQLTVQSFLSIFVSGILLLLGLTYGNVFRVYSYDTNLLEDTYRSMNKFETTLFYTSIFSLVLYVSYSYLLDQIQPLLTELRTKINNDFHGSEYPPTNI